MSAVPSSTGGATAADRPLPPRVAVWMFLSFAFAYFFSALLRAVTATLAPNFSAELGLNAADLGLLAGAYFFGFAAVQLPLGSALDRFGPRRVVLALLSLAVLGCAAFALARSLATLTLARALIGVGVSACLMAPMTAYRRAFDPSAQLRANSWMLMAGSLGMVASTLPVQWLLPLFGWRGLFWLVGGCVMLAMFGVARCVPRDPPRAADASPSVAIEQPGYRAVFRHPTFIRFAPLAFFFNGGLIAVQSLWAGPWLVQVGGWSAQQAAQGLFGINAAMLLSYLGWGIAVPRLYAAGWNAQRLIALGLPLVIVILALAIALGPAAGAGMWALFCVSCTFASLAQPAVGQAFATELAGRAVSGFNLVIFGGVFALQWGIGLAIDLFRSWGWAVVSAYQGAMALMAVCCVLSYAWFLWRDDRIAAPETSTPG
jgi:predicted MFS family arabinose efflux permease